MNASPYYLVTLSTSHLILLCQLCTKLILQFVQKYISNQINFLRYTLTLKTSWVNAGFIFRSL